MVGVILALLAQGELYPPVPGGGPAGPPGGPLPPGGVPAGPELPFTGSDITVGMLLVGILVLVGMALLLLSRRRRAAGAE
ncbi:MAG TPA: LPXTG cell wall anchor domain-containing protein [Actinomycetota bacterium]|nr:LPXTG cell wall anchor domain-containing protein [Actinomycetota bacterium]